MKFTLALIFATVMGGAAFGQTLDDSELDGIHAGFMDRFNQKFSIGAVMKSYVDGSLELTSTVSISQAGTTTTQQVGPQATALDAPALASAGIATGGAGAVVAGENGDTTFVHNFTADQITNMVVNSADNRSIVQDTNVMVVMPDLPALQESMAIQALGSRLQDVIGQQQLQAIGR